MSGSIGLLSAFGARADSSRGLYEYDDGEAWPADQGVAGPFSFCDIPQDRQDVKNLYELK